MVDRGSMTLITMLVGVAISIAALTATTSLLESAHARERAQHAADASALAGVMGGRRAADRIAAANAGVIVAWARHGTGGIVTVTVTVRVDSTAATARATNGP